MSGLLEAIRPFWLALLMVLFVAIVVWVYWPSRRRRLESHGRIPLEDEKER